MLKRILISCVLVSTLLLSACGGAAPAASNTQDAAAPTSDAASTDKEYTVWIPGDEAEYGFYFEMFENYKQSKVAKGETFNYKIEQQPWDDYWTKLPLEVSEGRGPDMFLAHEAYMDVLLPIAKELDLGDDILNSLKVKGIYTGANGKDAFVPTLFSTYIMFANKDLQDSDKYPTTWAEMEAAAKGAMAKTSGIIGLDYNFNIISPIMYSNGLSYTKDGKAVFHKQPFEQLAKMQADGITDYLNFGNGSQEESFNQGAVAYMQGAPWMEFWAPDDIKPKMAAFPIPRDAGSTDLVLAQAEPTFGINKNASDADFAVLNDVVKFMLTDEKTITNIVKGNSGIANNQNITVSYDPFTAGDAVTKTFDGRKVAYVVLPRDLEKVYKDSMEKVLSGQAVDDVLKSAETESATVAVERLSKMEDAFRASFK